MSILNHRIPDLHLNRDGIWFCLLLHRVIRRVLERLAFGSSFRYRVAKRTEEEVYWCARRLLRPLELTGSHLNVKSLMKW